MWWLRPFIALIMLCASVPMGMEAAKAQCRLCSDDEDQSGSANQPQTPLRITIEADIRFNRLAFAGAGAGEVQIDPTSGSTRTDGGLVDLGGLALTGSARITGEPGRAVRVDLPHSIRLTSQTGGHADLVSLQTSLSPSPRIGPDGTLVFSFAGTLKVSGGIGGHYRGRISITAEYE